MSDKSIVETDLSGSFIAGWDWKSKEEVDKELKKMTHISNKNTKAIKNLENDIKNLKMFQLINIDPLEGKCQKMLDVYLKMKEVYEVKSRECSQNVLKNTDKDVKQKIKEIESLQKKLNQINKELEETKQNRINSKKTYKGLQTNFCTILDNYSKYFGFKVEIQETNTDYFVAVLYFCPESKEFPIKIHVTTKKSIIFKINSSSILTKKQTEFLNEKLESLSDIFGIVYILRKIIKEKHN